MPGKGRKVAARQAQVGRRRRRQPREGVSIPGAGSGVVVAKMSIKCHLVELLIQIHRLVMRKLVHEPCLVVVELVPLASGVSRCPATA